MEPPPPDRASRAGLELISLNTNPFRRALAASLLIGVLLYPVGASVAATDQASATPAVESLLQAENARFHAQLERDVAALARGMADEVVYTHASGHRQTKSEYLRDVQSGRSPYRSIEARDRVTRVLGNVGVTRGVLHMIVGDKELSSSYLGVYIKRDGRWQLLDWQSSPSDQQEAGQLGATADCAALARLALPGASITSADSVAAGSYRVPLEAQRLGGRPGMNVAGRAELAPNPAFCRIAATLRPTSDSNIRIEVWMPSTGWNGKLLAIGNFGWGGSLMYVGMLTGLEAGYATTSTDTGHDDSKPDETGGKFTLGHPEKMIDYAYRADHLMTEAAKAVVKAFFGKGPAHSYWIGCSLGGLEGLIEAKRYPEDYDGIVAGAPPNPLTRFNALQLWPDWLISQDHSRLIPQTKYAMIHEAVLKACASPVGLKDGVVDEPDRCGFDPRQLECKHGDAPDCLTAPQVYLLQQTYAGPVNPRTHQSIFPGPAPGAELQMFGFANGETPWVALDLFRYAAFQNPDWDWTTMDWDQALAAAEDKIGPLMHVDANLEPFFAHGGKLLLYVGWTDYHNGRELMGYHDALIAQSGGELVRASVRLFTLPGMDHCAGGAGCDTFDKLGLINDWVEHGTAPEQIISSKVSDGRVVRIRPVCAYPKVARYNGAGEIQDAANFNCTVP